VLIESAPAGFNKLRLRKLSVIVFVVFGVVAAGLFIGARRLSADSERRLLTERTAEVGGLLASTVDASLQTSLGLLATASRQSPAAFAQAAKDRLSSGGASAIALMSVRGSNWVVQSAAGAGFVPGQQLTGARLALVKSAGQKYGSDVIVVAPGTSRLALVAGPPLSPPGTVLYQEFVVDPSKPVKITQAQPFHELDVALYVGRRAEPAKLLISTSHNLPLTGHVASRPVPVGGGSWLLVAKARQPLAGTLASNVPKIVLVAVLLLGLAMAALVESVARRRDYALSLVAQRTADLEDSLSQLGRARDALVISERLAALGQMAATVGHELRNPLSVLTNSLYLIRKTSAADDDEKVRRQLDTADREVSAATLIVSDLLEFARPRAAEPSNLDVPELLAEAVSVAPPPSGITVEQDLSPMPPIVTDRDQFRQVILNLLTNAYEAMPTGGTVRIVARVVDEAAEVAVSDTGIGMDEQTIAQVFEPFFSLKVKGTGLGLAVSKRMVESNGGTLNITARVDHGCTATMRLPMSLVGAGVGADR
jgi:signal transduction histidine kinase